LIVLIIAVNINDIDKFEKMIIISIYVFKKRKKNDILKRRWKKIYLA